MSVPEASPRRLTRRSEAPRSESCYYYYYYHYCCYSRYYYYYYYYYDVHTITITNHTLTLPDSKPRVVLSDCCEPSFQTLTLHRKEGLCFACLFACLFVCLSVMRFKNMPDL